MKKHLRLSPVLILSLVLGLAAGCSTSNVGLQVLVPAHISVPQNVQTLALLNRYRPEKGKGLLNVLEGAVSGENIGQDRRSAEAALTGLTDALAGSPRFRITRPGEELRGTGRAAFPDPLPPAEVQRICQQYRSEAMVTIEAFDSDTQVECVAEVRERKVDGEVQQFTVFVADKSIDVTVGWRMYNGSTGILLDEFRMFETVHFGAEGGTEAVAIGNLPGREPVTREIGDVTGRMYSERISPTWIPVNRTYYTKGSDALKAARHQVRFDDWVQAEEWWDKALENPDPKVKGRAMFNKALAAELRGDLSTALEMATEAGRSYGNNRARSYAQTLRRRLTEQEILDEQMQGAP
ncbi:MAG: DUF6340 family protein [Bacteroidota bacterium]